MTHTLLPTYYEYNTDMLNLSSFNIGSEDPKKLAEFYEKVLEKKPDMVENGWYGFLAGNCFIGMGKHGKVHGASEHPERIMFNFEASDVKGEFDRIKALGAKVIKEPYQMGEGEKSAWIATFADPDGNYFQLMTPWKG